MIPLFTKYKTSKMQIIKIQNRPSTMSKQYCVVCYKRPKPDKSETSENIELYLITRL